MSKRSFSRRLISPGDVESAIAEAYLRFVLRCSTVNVSREYPFPAVDIAPCITGWAAQGDNKEASPVAVVAGEHLRALLRRKKGFSVASNYLSTVDGYFASNSLVAARYIVFSLFSRIDESLVAKLADYNNIAITVFGPTSLPVVLAAIEPHVPGNYQPSSNWFVTTWSAIKFANAAGTLPGGWVVDGTRASSGDDA